MAATKKPTTKKGTTKKKSGSPGVFDVARPRSGALSPSGTTRPTIVKHQLMQDPMVNNQPNTELSAPPLKPTRKVVIKPLHDSVEPEPVQAEVVTKEVAVSVTVEADTSPELPQEIMVVDADETPETPEVSEVPKEVPAKPQKQPASKAEPDPEPQFSPDTTIDDVAPEPDTTAIPPSRKDRDEETEVARARAIRLQKLIDEEEFFLPIETLEERRSRRVAIFGLLLIIVLAAAWYDVALDASLLPNSFNVPHTSFFTVKS